MKTVSVEVKAGSVQHVECPRGVSVQVLDFDALSGTGAPEESLWEGEEWIESRLLQAAKAVVEKIDRVGFSKTCLDGTDIREAIAEAEEQQGGGDARRILNIAKETRATGLREHYRQLSREGEST